VVCLCWLAVHTTSVLTAAMVVLMFLVPGCVGRLVKKSGTYQNRELLRYKIKELYCSVMWLLLKSYGQEGSLTHLKWCPIDSLWHNMEEYWWLTFGHPARTGLIKIFSVVFTCVIPCILGYICYKSSNICTILSPLYYLFTLKYFKKLKYFNYLF
jgi:hypothetical protein